MHVARAKRGKTRASKSRSVLVLLPIGRESGARFFNQSQSVAMQNQSNCGITFDAQLKSALSVGTVFFQIDDWSESKDVVQGSELSSRMPVSRHLHCLLLPFFKQGGKKHWNLSSF